MNMAKILVVDDSLLSRKNLMRHLSEAGYEIVTANDGQEGVEKIKSESPDLVISDLLMPNLDGFGLLEAVKSQGLGVPVLVVSADIQETSREKVMFLGAKGILSKPPQKDDLLKVVEELLIEG